MKKEKKTRLIFSFYSIFLPFFFVVVVVLNPQSNRIHKRIASKINLVQVKYLAKKKKRI